MKRSITKIGAALLLLALAVVTLGQADLAARKLALYPSCVDGTRLSISSGEIRIAVNNTDGRFTIGNNAGKSLLFGFPSEGATSHSHFLVSDSIWGTYSRDGGLHPTEAPVSITPVLSEGSIITQYMVSGIEYTQRLTPTFIGDRATVLIEYTARNTTSETKNTGLLLFLDTMIGDNDYAPIATEYGYFSITREFIAPSIPTYWQAFESSPWQPEDSMIGSGILIGGSATPPDRIVFGDFWALRNVEWDYHVDSDPYSDSAVLLRWDSRPLLPGESRRMATYYGLGSAIISIGDLNLSLSSPEELTVVSCDVRTPNPFPIDLLVSNTTGTTINGLNAEIKLPSGIILEDGFEITSVSPSELPPGGTGSVNWLLNIPDSLFPNDTTMEVTVAVYGSGTDTFEIDMDIDIPGIDSRGPIAELIAPSPGATVSCDTLVLLYRLADAHGIDESTIDITIGGETWEYPDSSVMEFDASFLTCFIPVEHFELGEIDVSLGDITDSRGCIIRGTTDWSFILDNQPPNVNLIYPSPGDTIYNDDFQIQAFLADYSGIDESSLYWTVDDSPAEIHSDFSSGTATFSPVEEGFTPIGLTEWHVCLNGISDNITGSCGPNETVPVCVDFYTDFQSPSAEPVFPEDGDFVSCETFDITTRIHDRGCRIDESSISLLVNSIEYHTDDPELSYSDSLLVFSSTEPFGDEEIIELSLNATTEGGIPLVPLDWSCQIDRAEPYVTPISPEDMVFHNLDDNVSFITNDDISGVNYDSLIVSLETDGRSITMDLHSPELDISGDTVSFSPMDLGLSLEGCAFISIDVRVADFATGCGPNLLDDYSWRVDIPCTPPFVGPPNIDNGSYVSCDTLNIWFFLIDEEGIKFESINPIIDGIPIEFGGDYCHFHHDSIHFKIPRVDFPSTEIDINIDAIEDIFGNRTDTPIDLRYHWDNQPPVIESLTPEADAVLSEAPYLISIQSNDSGAGIDISNCWISIGGIAIDEPHGLTFDGTNLAVPTHLFGDISVGETEICARIADRAIGCGFNYIDTCWTFTLDQAAPIVNLLTPINGSICGCDPITFEFTAVDEQGIDPTSIVILANNDTISFDSPDISFSYDIIEFSTSNSRFTHNSPCSVAVLDIADSSGNHITEPIGGYFNFDFNPPSVSLFSPIESGKIEGPSQKILFQIEDSPSGVNENSIIISLGENTFETPNSAIRYEDSIVEFDPKIAGIQWSEDIEICLISQDNADLCPNIDTSCFHLEYDPSSITVTASSPSADDYVACNPLEIVLDIETQHGINVDHARAICGSQAVDAYNGISLSMGEVIIAFPENSIDEGYREISILGIKDTLGNALGQFNLTLNIDYSNPNIAYVYPHEGELVSPNGLELKIYGLDEISGLDIENMIIEIGDILLDYSDPQVYLYNDTIIVDLSGFNLDGLTSVDLHLPDNAQQCGPNTLDYSWNFTIAGEGPVFTLLEPANGSITHVTNQLIRILVTDSDGLNCESLVLSIGDENLYHPSMQIHGDTIIYSNNNQWQNSCEYEISISGMDQLGNSTTNSLGAFTTDFQAPELVSAYPEIESNLTELPDVFELMFADNISGVNLESIELSIDNIEYNTGDEYIEYIDNRLIIDILSLGLTYKAPDSILISITSLEDNTPDYGTPNRISEPIEFYYFMVEDGCVALPKPFSPNGDGYYDEVTIYTGIKEQAEIKIYNQSGKMIRSGEGIGKWSWDGKDNYGRPMKPDIYLYIIKNSDGQSSCGGTITLVR